MTIGEIVFVIIIMALAIMCIFFAYTLVQKHKEEIADKEDFQDHLIEELAEGVRLIKELRIVAITSDEQREEIDNFLSRNDNNEDS